MNAIDTLKLLAAPTRNLSPDDASRRKRIARKMLAAAAVAYAASMAWSYWSVYHDYPDGPPREIFLRILHAMHLSMILGVLSFGLIRWSSRVSAPRAICLSVLATVGFVAGGIMLTDIALQLRTAAVRTEIQAVALSRIGKIAFSRDRSADIDGVIRDSADYVRGLRDPEKVRAMHAENDEILLRYLK